MNRLRSAKRIGLVRFSPILSDSMRLCHFKFGWGQIGGFFGKFNSFVLIWRILSTKKSEIIVVFSVYIGILPPAPWWTFSNTTTCRNRVVLFLFFPKLVRKQKSPLSPICARAIHSKEAILIDDFCFRNCRLKSILIDYTYSNRFQFATIDPSLDKLCFIRKRRLNTITTRFNQLKSIIFNYQV